MIKDINAITPEYMKHRIEEETQQYKQEIEKLHSIIKEVREYIESFNLPKDLGVLGEAPISISELKHILEILDKKENI